MAMKRTMIGAIASIAVMGAVLATYAALISSRTFSNTTAVAGVNVGVFWDSACTNQTSSINWGMMNPDATKTQTLYINNTGTASVTLNMIVDNWIPSGAAGNFTVTWDKEGATLNVNSITPAVITLYVSPSAPGIAGVTFNITIKGTH